MDLSNQLKQLGLGDYESLVLETLIQNSPTNATFIAKKCGLSRSSVYTTLSSLTAKGLVGTTYKNDVKQFVANDVGSFEQFVLKQKKIVDERLASVQELKQTISSFQKLPIHVPNIIFFEGQEGLKKIYMSMMVQAKKGSELFLLRDEFVWREEWDFIYESAWHDTIKQLKFEKDIRTKLLINASKEEKKNLPFYSSRVGLAFRFSPPANRVHDFALYIIEDIVSVLSFEHNNLIGIRIINHHLAENFKIAFQLMWKGAGIK